MAGLSHFFAGVSKQRLPLMIILASFGGHLAVFIDTRYTRHLDARYRRDVEEANCEYERTFREYQRIVNVNPLHGGPS
ncbi:hypothetical protein C7212DRAFT_308904, partial [Tuber magnatum]